MINTDICIIGAGPAGLAASIEAARYGAKVTLVDENHRAGGQLFKQIHKFFGSHNHQAGIRGFDIGENLLKEAIELGVDIHLRTVAYGIFEDGIIGINDIDKQKNGLIKAKKTILATGAIENALPFNGWTKPGVMGAGAAQTLMNLYGLQPGKRVVMVGTGNVGLIVSYQLLQAGVEVVAIVEAAPKVTGYLVHSRKLLRSGVPIYTSTTVKEAKGQKGVDEVIIISLDEKFSPIKESEKVLGADTVCIAVGLSPLSELARLAGCDFSFIKTLGGFVPKHDKDMKTTKNDVYVAGDIAGIEEASSAMEEGRLAGIAAAESLGLVETAKAKILKVEYENRLLELRQGVFGTGRREAKKELVKESEK